MHETTLRKSFPKPNLPLVILAILSASAWLAATSAAAPAGGAPAPEGADTVRASGDELSWTLAERPGPVWLVLSGPRGFHVERRFAEGERVFLWPGGGGVEPLLDGSYRWRLVTATPLTDEQRRQLEAARAEGGPRAVDRVRESMGFRSRTLSGHVLRHEGRWIPAAEEGSRESEEGVEAKSEKAGVGDLVVHGQACIGPACVPPVTFGTETLRLQETTARLLWVDTSTGTGLPTNDWQMVANDVVSGGQEKFSIEDVDAGTVPFTLAARAPDDSVYVTDAGRLGLGTPTPATDAHIVRDHEPSLRLEQDASGGFTAQAWDLTGDDQSFALRDVT
ncbi:MAG: hypothetical protein MI919_41735, partial [Holophagales bacterium]|nr:hypothetical protein [Holophagales bacterium]